MRNKFNRQAICNSGNYRASRKAHLDFLQERHEHFCNLMVSGEIKLDVPVIKNGTIEPKFKTVTIWGKQMRLSIEEYNTHYLKANL